VSDKFSEFVVLFFLPGEVVSMREGPLLVGFSFFGVEERKGMKRSFFRNSQNGISPCRVDQIIELV
jgi:hypothetical protein